MVALPTDHRAQFTVEEYFALEAASETRHEYYEGEIIAMSGARSNHVQIVSNLNRRLSVQLDERPSCRAFSNDMRVRVSGKIYFYPDVLVVCDPHYADATQTMLINPALIVEVTSTSTSMYDRITKLEAYKQLPSVQDILIIDQYRVHVQQFSRVAKGWLVQEFTTLTDAVTLESLGCTLSVSEIYAKVDFQA